MTALPRSGETAVDASLASEHTGLDPRVQPRAMCYRCFKPASRCVCHDLRRVNNRTGITLILHPRERHHPLGTLRLAELGLSGVHTLVDTLGSVRRGPRPLHLPSSTGLLYPSPSARELTSLDPSDRPEHLVVLDGTWTQVKTVFRDTAWLHHLPHYRLTPTTPSRYRIRREPKLHYVSTIESLVLALQTLEPETEGLDELLHAFDRMIDRQIASRNTSSGAHFHRNLRPEKQRLLPRALFAPARSLVVVYSEEHTLSPDDATAGPATRLTCAALRPASGDLLVCAIGVQSNGPGWGEPRAGRDASPLPPGVEPLSQGQFAERWSKFTQPDDVFVTWSSRCLGRLPTAHAVEGRRHVVLKSAYGRLGRVKGPLEAIASHEGLPSAPGLFPGRIGQRLSQAAALLDWLRQRHGTEPC